MNVHKCLSMLLTKKNAWAEYLFTDGSMIGLNKELLDGYIEWIANKRMIVIGKISIYCSKS